MEASALTDLVVITGFSGAGKSTAMAVFEDEGYFCVDNLPSEMIRSLVDLFVHAGSKVARAAVVSDARGGSYFEGLVAMLESLRSSGVRHRILFLEAGEQTLLTRYKETRRRHPLAPTGSVAEGIARERELLAPLRDRADVVIDTSMLTAAMLRRKLTDELLPTNTPGRLAVTFQSFGFKYGPSRDADLLFDVRFLPNPHGRQLLPHAPRLAGRAGAGRLGHHHRWQARVHRPGTGHRGVRRRLERIPARSQRPGPGLATADHLRRRSRADRRGRAGLPEGAASKVCHPPEP